MKNAIRALTIVGCLLLALMAVASNIWFSNSFDVRVTGADGRPITDAVVLAVWRAREPLTGSLHTLLTREALTEGNGSISIGRWGPTFSRKVFSSVDGTQPEIWVVSPHHFPIVRQGPLAFRSRLMNVSPLTTGIAIELEPLPNVIDQSVQMRVEALAMLAKGMEYGIDVCVWKDARAFEATFADLESSVGVQGGWFPSSKCPKGNT